MKFFKGGYLFLHHMIQSTVSVMVSTMQSKNKGKHRGFHFSMLKCIFTLSLGSTKRTSASDDT